MKTEKNWSMKERIAQILRSKNLSATEFAAKLGIQPSSISHLLSGRNNPSLDFVKKLKETFPEYNLDWIIFGKKPVTVSDSFNGFSSESVSNKVSKDGELPLDDGFSNTLFDESNIQPVSESVVIPKGNDVEIKKIVIVYKDNSFEVLHPRS